MSDYFTTLAANNLGFIRPLQPRIPSQYETPATRPDDVHPESASFESEVARANDAPGGRSGAIVEAQQEQTNIRDWNGVEEESLGRAAGPATQPHGEVSKPDRSEGEMQQANEPPHFVFQISGLQTIRMEPEQTQDLSRELISQQSIAPKATIGRGAGAARIVPEAGREGPVEGALRTEVETFPTPRETAGPPTDFNRMPPSAKSSEPTIHVTIGRIEVTAVTPPPVVRKPKAVPDVPRVSL